MNIQEFFNAYLDIWVETNKSSNQATNDQCVDLWRAYNRKVIGAPDIFGNPPDIWNNYQSEYYERISNSPTAVPRLGDVVIWKASYGGYGHIAICTDIADTKTFTSFDQNDPANEPAHYQPHTYSYVQGWLRPKKDVTGGSVQQPEQNKALEVLSEAYRNLPEGDPYKEGNLEGFVRGLISEHSNFEEYKHDSLQLNGFISKWEEKWNLTNSGDLIEIENEMSKLLNMEDTLRIFREAIEKAVGKTYSDDKSLLKALDAVEDEKEAIENELKDCNLKLSNTKIIYAFTLFGYPLKIYEKKK
jgi:hypothetical protein